MYGILCAISTFLETSVMSTYTNDGAGLWQREVHLYGSSRLGLHQVAVNLSNPAPENIITVGDITGKARTFERGNKFFELSNHLGNVLVTVSDRRRSTPNTGNPALVSRYQAVVLTAQDYYAFGMIMPGRSFQSTAYRYGFNGKENDNEVKGAGNQQDYGMRIYDPRVGRFLSIDPMQKKYPSISPFLYALNNPIVMIDRDGEDAIVSITRNKDGGGVIKVQTIVHITGATEDWRVMGYNSHAKKMYPEQTVNVEGKTWNIQYDIKYVYDKTFDASKMKEGENVLKIDPNTSMSGPNRTHVGPQTNQGLIAVEHRKYNEVIGHETGHLIGFNDQYTEIKTNDAGFGEYIKNKYNTKEDMAPGGTTYQILNKGRELKYSMSIANQGYENNNMQNNKGGFTNAQNLALVNKALSESAGNDGPFIIKGIFDSRGTPSQEDLQKAYESLEAKIQEAIKADKPQK